MWRVSTTNYPTARKQHTCDACRSTIHPGAEYQRTKGLWEGVWCTFKWCGRCRPCQGEHLTPEQALLEAATYDCRAHPAHPDIVIDGAVVRMYGAEHIMDGEYRSATYEAVIVPGRGLTTWQLVARAHWDREHGHTMREVV